MWHCRFCPGVLYLETASGPKGLGLVPTSFFFFRWQKLFGTHLCRLISFLSMYKWGPPRSILEFMSLTVLIRGCLAVLYKRCNMEYKWPSRGSVHRARCKVTRTQLFPALCITTLPEPPRQASITWYLSLVQSLIPPSPFPKVQLVTLWSLVLLGLGPFWVYTKETPRGTLLALSMSFRKTMND